MNERMNEWMNERMNEWMSEKVIEIRVNNDDMWIDITRHKYKKITPY